MMLNELKTWGKQHLGKETEKRLRRYFFPVLRALEAVLFGTQLRRGVLLWFLKKHFASRKRRLALWYTTVQHFTDFDIILFDFAFSDRSPGPHTLYRAFYTSEVVQLGDHVLDIGCGDGFFTKHFVAPSCAHVDALDIDDSAIRIANDRNSTDNINYFVADAIRQPFLSLEGYDVVVWDGAIGHFPRESTLLMLSKIKNSLRPEGVFVGSESLGTREGRDHLQFFETIDEFSLLFKQFFKFVEIREVLYPSPGELAFRRREAYWRCSNSENRLNALRWHRFH